jgi:hypothetical protein
LTSDALSASEYARRLAEVRDRERRANDAIRHLEERISRIESIENDPIALVRRPGTPTPSPHTGGPMPSGARKGDEALRGDDLELC